jgi:hypothetical protein
MEPELAAALIGAFVGVVAVGAQCVSLPCDRPQPCWSSSATLDK